MSRFAAPLLALALASPGRAEELHFEVSADGTGDFTTVQQAIDHVPDGASDWTVIHVRPGHYFERLQIPVSKQRVILVGDGRDETVIEYDESYLDSQGQLVAAPVLTNHALDVVVRALSIHNLAREPGGSGGKWDAAIVNEADRLILHDVFLRADHDTLLMYGPPFPIGGPGHGHVYVRDSHIQGRGDFIAAFTCAFIENSVLETIRDRGHFLFHMGIHDHPLNEEDALVVKNSTFTGQSLDPVWPAGATNLFEHAHVVLVGNVFEYDIGANRALVHFHDEAQALSSQVRHFGNTQNLSTLEPLIWDHYTVPGPPGTPRLELPVVDNDEGEPIVAALSPEEAVAVTPLWLFADWDPTLEEPRLDCENGIDDDGDQLTDLDDPGCAMDADVSELSAAVACDNGADDDGDGWIDFAGGDPGCRDPLWSAENPACQDGVNNDLQPGTDYDGGISLHGTGGADPAGPDPQCQGEAWRNTENVTAPPAAWGCGMGIELVVALPLLARLRRRGLLRSRAPCPSPSAST